MTVKKALESGADGFLSKDCHFNEIGKAFRTIDTNNIYIEDVIQEKLAKNNFGFGRHNGIAAFSGREKEVFAELILRKKEKEIANKLHISIHGVHHHRVNIYKKTNCHSIEDLIKYAESADVRRV